MKRPGQGFRSFDRVAVVYERAERLLFGDRLQAARTAGLTSVATPEYALLLGEGDGRFAEELLDRFPGCRIRIVDQSQKMLELAQRRLARFGARAECVKGDALQADLGGPYDLVTTLFFLDCFDASEQRQLIGRITSALRPIATWLYADFDPGPAGFRGVGHKLVLWGLYAGFGALTDIRTMRYHDPLPLLAEHGFDAAGRLQRRGLLRHAALSRNDSAPGDAAPNDAGR